MKARQKPEQTPFGYALKIPFLARDEFDRFSNFCKDRAHTQGGFARIAILEKLDREEKRRPA